MGVLVAECEQSLLGFARSLAETCTLGNLQDRTALPICLRAFTPRPPRVRAERRRRTPATIDDVDRWAGIVATIADEVGQRFPGCELVVLMEDRRGGFAPEMLERLASIDCRVLRTAEMMPEEPMHPTRWTLPRDPHPSAEATEHIARSLADSLRVRTEGGR